MKHSKRNRLLALVLALCLSFSFVLPIGASGFGSGSEAPTEVSAAAESGTGSFLRIFHLDNGRKYFSVSDIKGIIDKLAENSYTHLQLAVGNDALRFLLDDMSVGDYSSDKVKTAIQNANSSYSSEKSTDAGALSQSNMDEILSYAKSKNISVIPLINSPGHMRVLLAAMNALGLSSYSATALEEGHLSLTDVNQVSFVQGLLQKYIAYFSDKGCTYFNMGADEYSFNTLNSSGYASFVSYINQVSTMIKAAGMKPIAFNDGIYYKSTDSAFASAAANIDRDIFVAYWTGADNYASSSTLSEKGFTLLSNNSAWYYVLGDALYGSDAWGANGQWGYKDSKAGLKSTPCTKLQDDGSAPVIGSVLCVWCDYPRYSYESAKVYDLIATMAENNRDYFPGPFQITGTKTPVLMVDGTMTLTANREVASWVSSNEAVATVEAVPSGGVSAAAVTTASSTAIVHAVAPGTATITATCTDGMTADYAVSVTDGSVPITLAVGDTAVEYQDGDVTGQVGSYKTSVVGIDAEYQETEAETISYRAVATASKSAYNNYVSSNLIDGNAGTYYWSDGSQSVGMYVQVDLGTAIPFDTIRLISPANTQDLCENAAVQVSADGTSWTTIGSYTGSSKPSDFSNTIDRVRYIRVVITKAKNNWWQLSEIQWGNTTNSTFTRMPASGTVTVEAKQQTKITFTGKTAGNTTVKIGDTTYNITVVPEDVGKAASLPIQLWITNAPISVSGVTTATSGTFYYFPGYYAPDGTYAYYIDVTASQAYNENGVPLSELVPAGVIGQENGTATTANDPNATHLFWKGTRLTSTDGTTGLQYVWQDDMSSSGSDFTYVRYWGGKWEISADGKSNWTEVTGEGSRSIYSSCREQIIAYYKMRTTLTDEVTTDVVDWGGNIPSSNANSNFAVLDFSVKYEGGTRHPASNGFPITDKTRVYNTTGNVITDTDSDDNTYRIVSEISVENDTDYEVYMITLTPTSARIANSLSTSTAEYTYPTETDAEKVIWAKTADALPDDYKDSSRWYTAKTDKASSLTFNADSGTNVGGDPVIPKIEIQEKYGLLITYYIRPIRADLTVRYVDASAPEKPFYSYGITVKANTLFDDPTDHFIDGVLNDYTVAGLTREVTVYSDLMKMDGVPATYRYAKWTCVDVTRSDDGKILTLYYNLSRDVNLVVDFGLPLTITPYAVNSETLGENYNRINSVNIKSVSGGSAEVNGKDVIFTPDSVFGQTGAALTITYSGTNLVSEQENSITYTVGVIPASNVLYEGDFLTENTTTGTNYRNWTPSKPDSKAQDNNQETLYGYDPVYANTLGQNNSNSAWTISDLESGKGSKYLTTSFYGNGFDLIGNAGPDTGYVYLILQEVTATGTNVKEILVIDTSHVHGTLTQVPLAHLEFDEGNYIVNIRAAYRAGTSAQSAATYSTYSTNGGYSAMEDVYATLNDLYLDGFETDNVELVYFDQSSALAGMDNASAVYASNSAGTMATDTARDPGTTVTIDGFRVYRSSNNLDYIKSEQNVTYTNVLDAVKESQAVYTEFNSNYKFKDGIDYESNGGPQNEIYLNPGQSVVLNSNLTKGTIFQVSARAVTSTSSQINNTTDIASNTEMYYTVTVGDDGTIVIANTGEGMLALGNLKSKAAFSAVTEQTLSIASAMLRSYAAGPAQPDPDPVPEPDPTPVNPQPAVFTPARLTAGVKSISLFRSRINTVAVTTSTDAVRLTVNGKELKPTNSLMVQLGLSRYYTYVLVDTVKKNETRSYEVIAYNADGVASKAHIAKG